MALLVVAFLAGCYLLGRELIWAFDWHKPLSFASPHLLPLAGAAFLASYYLPFRAKRPAVALLTLVGAIWLFGAAPIASLLAWHLAAYAAFHPGPGSRSALAGAAGFALCVTAVSFSGVVPSLWWIPLAAPSTLAFWAAFRFLLLPALQGRARPWIHGALTHAGMLYVGAGFLWNLLAGSEAPRLQAFHLLYFWQWERMVMYRIDVRDRRVPEDLSFGEYLATFFSPAFLANVTWINRIPKGYAYLARNFLARDKNKIALSGVGLLALAFLFFLVRGWLRINAPALVVRFGLPQALSYGDLLALFSRGEHPGAAWVWTVMIFEFLRFYFLWSGVAHLKVGLWRLCGYDIEPYFQRPFLSVNLVELWRRYSYYYREFLVHAFYYPVFLRFFRRRPYLRVFAATFAAACFGNLLFHVYERSLYHGAGPATMASQLRTLPYYLLLGGAISLTQVWLIARGRGRRRPWTPGWRIGFDLLSVAGTLGFFILIRPFHHVPVERTLADAWRIVSAALGF